jgi:hypothetical protein
MVRLLEPRHEAIRCIGTVALCNRSIGWLSPDAAGVRIWPGCSCKNWHSCGGKFIPGSRFLAGLNDFGMGYYMFACAPLPFLLLIFGRKGAPEGVAHQINTIRALLEEERAPHAQRTLVWRAITSKYLEAVQPDLSRGPSLQDLFKEAKDELKIGRETRS